MPAELVQLLELSWPSCDKMHRKARIDRSMREYSLANYRLRGVL
jgi:hypothetical protein